MSGSYTHMAGHGSLLQLVWLSSGRVEGSQRCSSTIPVVFSTQWTICLWTPGIPAEGERRDFVIKHTNMTPSCTSVRVIYVQHLEGTWWATDRWLWSKKQSRGDWMADYKNQDNNNNAMVGWAVTINWLVSWKKISCYVFLLGQSRYQILASQYLFIFVSVGMFCVLSLFWQINDPQNTNVGRHEDTHCKKIYIYTKENYCCTIKNGNTIPIIHFLIWRLPWLWQYSDTLNSYNWFIV